MKKITTIILSIFLTSVLIAYFWYGNAIENQKITLSGFPTSENLYQYFLNNDKYNLNGYYMTNNTIYFLLDKEEYYELYKENIYDSKATPIGELDSAGYCNLENNLITCSSNDKISLYDLELKLKYETAISEEEFIYVIPYKDTFLKLNNNLITLDQNNEEVPFKTLEEEFNNYTFIKYYYQKENTFLLFTDLNTNTYFLYDIKENKYEEIYLTNYNIYENGFYFYNEENFQIYNLKDNTTKEYPNNLKNNNPYKTILSNDNNTLYLYDNIAKNLEIIDLEKNTLEKSPLNISNEEINELIYNSGYLFILTLTDKTNLYVYDLPSLNLTKIDLTTYVSEQELINTELINNIKEKYNVNIHIKEEAIIKYPDFKAELLSDYHLINQALNKIETILSKANINFYNTFYNNKYEGLNIYLTGELTPSNYDTQYSNPVAYSLFYNNEYMIVLNIIENGLEDNFCHELMHNIEFNMEKNNINPFQDWDKYNPEDFTYAFSYTKGSSFGYTIYESDINNAYFIDTYAHTYPNEDRARLFEKICAYEESSIVNEFPNLLAKAKYLKDEIINNFPSLEESSLFNSLNTN